MIPGTATGSDHKNSYEACVRNLWLAVITRAVKDYYYAVEQEQEDVMEWVVGTVGSFHLASDALGVPVPILRELMLKKIVAIDMGEDLYIDGKEARMRK